MNLSDQLLDIGVEAGNLLNPEHESFGDTVQTTDVHAYFHSDDREEIAEAFHGTIYALLQRGAGAEEVFSVPLQWLLDALRKHGLPDDLDDLPTVTFPPTPSIPTLLG